MVMGSAQGSDPMNFRRHAYPPRNGLKQLVDWKKNLQIACNEEVKANLGKLDSVKSELQKEQCHSSDHSPKKKQKTCQREESDGSSKTCCVLGCTNTSETMGLVSMPKDPQLRLKWIKNINRRDWAPADDSAVCQIHFEPKQWEKNREGTWLSLNSIQPLVPTLYLHGELLMKEELMDMDHIKQENVEPRKTAEDNNEAGCEAKITGYIQQDLEEAETVVPEFVCCKTETGSSESSLESELYEEEDKLETKSGVEVIAHIHVQGETETIVPDLLYNTIKTKPSESSLQAVHEPCDDPLEWSCLICFGSFSTKRAVKSHIKRCHPNKSPEMARQRITKNDIEEYLIAEAILGTGLPNQMDKSQSRNIEYNIFDELPDEANEAGFDPDCTPNVPCIAEAVTVEETMDFTFLDSVPSTHGTPDLGKDSATRPSVNGTSQSTTRQSSIIGTERSYSQRKPNTSRQQRSKTNRNVKFGLENRPAPTWDRSEENIPSFTDVDKMLLKKMSLSSPYAVRSSAQSNYSETPSAISTTQPTSTHIPLHIRDGTGNLWEISEIAKEKRKRKVDNCDNDEIRAKKRKVDAENFAKYERQKMLAAERQRRFKEKMSEEQLEKKRERDRERLRRLRENKVIKPIAEMEAADQKKQRTKWKKYSAIYRQKQKNLKNALRSETPPNSQSEIDEPAPRSTQRARGRQKGRRDRLKSYRTITNQTEEIKNFKKGIQVQKRLKRENN